MPVNCESWLIQTTLSSASAANVYYWAYPDRRITTGRHRCGNRRCGSWPGSMLSIWTIRAVAAAGWSSTWPEKASRSAAIGCENSCGAWVTGDLPTTPHDRARRAIRAISLPGGPQASQGSGPDLGDRYHLHPAAGRLPLPGGDRGSVLQKRSQLEAVK